MQEREDGRLFSEEQLVEMLPWLEALVEGSPVISRKGGERTKAITYDDPNILRNSSNKITVYVDDDHNWVSAKKGVYEDLKEKLRNFFYDIPKHSASTFVQIVRQGPSEGLGRIYMSFSKEDYVKNVMGKRLPELLQCFGYPEFAQKVAEGAVSWQSVAIDKEDPNALFVEMLRAPRTIIPDELIGHYLSKDVDLPTAIWGLRERELDAVRKRNYSTAECYSRKETRISDFVAREKDLAVGLEDAERISVLQNIEDAIKKMPSVVSMIENNPSARANVDDAKSQDIGGPSATPNS